jgi:hypothetical protein
VLSITKQDMYSGFNNVIKYSVEDEGFADKFGFKDEELK